MMDDGIFSVTPPAVPGKDRVFSILTLSPTGPSANDPGSDAVDAQVTVIGGSGDGSSDVSKMLLVTTVLVHTMHAELTAKIMAMERDLKDMERSLKNAQRSKDTAERAKAKGPEGFSGGVDQWLSKQDMFKDWDFEEKQSCGTSC